MDFEGRMAEKETGTHLSTGEKPRKPAGWWRYSSGARALHDSDGGALAPNGAVHRGPSTTLCNETEDNYPLRNWVFQLHTFSFGCCLLGHQPSLLETKISQRFQLLLMSPKCFHCHSLRLQLFNKFP